MIETTFEKEIFEMMEENNLFDSYEDSVSESCDECGGLLDAFGDCTNEECDLCSEGTIDDINEDYFDDDLDDIEFFKDDEDDETGSF